MISSKLKKGFTIVELLIVIVVIGILATLVIVTFSGIQQRGRDSQRRTDINAIASHVSAYYADKGYYPTLADLNDATWRGDNAKGLDAEALKDPKSTAAPALAAAVSSTSYAYVASSSDVAITCDNTAASSDTNQCDTYVLTADLEQNGAANYTKQSN